VSRCTWGCTPEPSRQRWGAWPCPWAAGFSLLGAHRCRGRWDNGTAFAWLGGGGEKCHGFKNRFGVLILGRQVRGKATSACAGGEGQALLPRGQAGSAPGAWAPRAAPGGVSLWRGTGRCVGVPTACACCAGVQPPWGGDAQGPPRFGLLPQLCPHTPVPTAVLGADQGPQAGGHPVPGSGPGG